MREIRCRVWDKTINYMDERVRVTMIDKDIKVEVLDGFSDWRELNKDEFILMWDTGLKDINGNKIHEGDVIRTNYPDCTAVVEWDTARYIGYTIESERKIIYVDRVDKHNKSAVEVIGNIFENPELLQEY